MAFKKEGTSHPLLRGVVRTSGSAYPHSFIFKMNEMDKCSLYVPLRAKKVNENLLFPNLSCIFARANRRATIRKWCWIRFVVEDVGNLSSTIFVGPVRLH